MVTKIRGLTLTGAVKEEMDTERMLEFIEAVQDGDTMEIKVPQQRLVINGVSKRISAKEVATLYSNHASDKRYYNPQAHKSKMWPYGVTSYET